MPITLITIIEKADIKIVLVFFCAILLKKEVILDFSSFL